MGVIVSGNGVSMGERLVMANSVADAWRILFEKIVAGMDELAAKPASSVVLLPFAQLMPVARGFWDRFFPDLPAPRFETSSNWALGFGEFSPSPSCVSFDFSRDFLTALGILRQAGYSGEHGFFLAKPLVEQAWVLARLAASVPPYLRGQWLDGARSALPRVSDDEGDALAIEAALAYLAAFWAGGSSFSSDVLFSKRAFEGVDALFLVRGFLADELLSSLAERFSHRAVWLDFPDVIAPVLDEDKARVFACSDSEQEALLAAACVLDCVQKGRLPVALVANDRVLTRRVLGLLASCGVSSDLVRDETGQKFSTVFAAGRLVAFLRAFAFGASSDDVFAFVKQLDVFCDSDLRAVEDGARRLQLVSWSAVAREFVDSPVVLGFEAWRAVFSAGAGKRSFSDWLLVLREVLVSCGLWGFFVDEGNLQGRALLEAIGFVFSDVLESGGQGLVEVRQEFGFFSSLVFSFGDFSRWIRDVLEGGVFRSALGENADALVVVLPMGQLLGREWGSVVMAGCGERFLPAAPDVGGFWGASVARELFLPDADALRLSQQRAFSSAVSFAGTCLFFSEFDERGESVLPSALVSLGLFDGRLVLGDSGVFDERFVSRALSRMVIQPPRAVCGDLFDGAFSASSYEVLRSCPYQFFGRFGLGLRDLGELEGGVDRRDWGLWFHDVLRFFHESLAALPDGGVSAGFDDWVFLFDAAASKVSALRGFDEGDFLPFSAVLSDVRDFYLRWLEGHFVSDGWRFFAAERTLSSGFGGVRLRGVVDRWDRLPARQGGGVSDVSSDGIVDFLIDYKTESVSRTRERVRNASEDVQLAFYALLVAGRAPRAAYLNLSERSFPALFEPEDLSERASLLCDGIVSDARRMREGEPLLALGEGSVCDWCFMRGLCRKDFWGK